MIRLTEHHSEHGAVTILRSRQKASHIYMHGDSFQSEADSRGISLASYIHAIFGLVHQSRARSILLIGCAGGTLATMLALAGYDVTAVDINPVAFEFARRYFSLPENVECFVADGRRYLETAERRFDVIVLDAYNGDTIPSHLASLPFFFLVRSCLAPDGVFLANIHIRDDSEQQKNPLAACAALVWSAVRLLDTPGTFNRNALIAAGAVASLALPRLHLVPASDGEAIESELLAMTFSQVRPLAGA